MSSLTDQDIVALRAVLATQHRLVTSLGADLDRVELNLTGTSDQRKPIAELEQLLASIEADQDWLEADDLATFDPAAILRLYRERSTKVKHTRSRLGADNWATYVRRCQAYLLANGVDPLTPYEALLTPASTSSGSAWRTWRRSPSRHGTSCCSTAPRCSGRWLPMRIRSLRLGLRRTCGEEEAVTVETGNESQTSLLSWPTPTIWSAPRPTRCTTAWPPA